MPCYPAPQELPRTRLLLHLPLSLPFLYQRPPPSPGRHLLREALVDPASHRSATPHSLVRRNHNRGACLREDLVGVHVRTRSRRLAALARALAVLAVDQGNSLMPRRHTRAGQDICPTTGCTNLDRVFHLFLSYTSRAYFPRPLHSTRYPLRPARTPPPFRLSPQRLSNHRRSHPHPNPCTLRRHNKPMPR